MTNKIKILAYLLPIIIGLNACEMLHDSEVNDPLYAKPSIRRAIDEIDFPYTSTDQLKHYLEHDPDLICPQIARLVASYELLEGGYQLLESLRSDEMYQHVHCEYHLDHDYIHVDWKLTDYPRVILDFDGQVKYYEFGLVENHQITSIITVHARREEPRAIAYIIPYVLPYDFIEYDYYIGLYPHRVIQRDQAYQPVDHNDGESYGYIDSIEYWQQIEAQADKKESGEIDNFKKNISISDTSNSEEVTNFWAEVAFVIQETSASLNINPPCVTEVYPINIQNAYIEHLKGVLGTSDYCRDHTANPYCSAALQQTFWTGACGPAGLAWIYRGLRSTYPQINGVYLPIHGDNSQLYFGVNSNYSYYYYSLSSLESLNWTYYSHVKEAYIDRSRDVDNGLTGIFYNKCFAIKTCSGWEFPMLPCYLNSTLRAATDDIFGVSCDKTAKYAADWIQDHNLPVMLLRADLSHYLVAYGYGGISSSPGGDISRKNLYFLVTDNGFTTSQNAYKPYWRAYKRCEYYHCVQRIDM